MKLLYFAHDFPPERSPQSLRTARLTAGLVAAGHDVTVITREMHLHESASGSDLPGEDSVRLIRLPAGPLNQFVDRVLTWHQRRKPTGREDESLGNMAPPSSANAGGMPAASKRASSTNWKGRLIADIRTQEDRLWFPGRGYFWAQHAKRWLMSSVNNAGVDGVILSHEPASALLLAQVCTELGIPFVAELGDPVLASYTPVKWTEKALVLERFIANNARSIVVTSEATSRLLTERHGTLRKAVSVVAQGFDFQPKQGVEPVLAAEGISEPLKLVYCGRFYRFRDPTPLFEAIDLNGANAELEMASPEIPEWLEPSLASIPNITNRGFLSHAGSLALQRNADVLVNFANADPVQVPGKFYEYLGMCKPILHISPHPDTDPQALMVKKLKRGWVLQPDSQKIADEIARLTDRKRVGELVVGLDLSATSVIEFSWENLGFQFAKSIENAFSDRRTGTC